MIPSDDSHFTTFALSHPGMTGKNNEDRFAYAEYYLSASDPTPVLFALVADGVGGKQAGEIAAQITVEHVSEVVAKSNGTNPVAIMEKALVGSNQLILEKAAGDSNIDGMATTATLAWIIKDRLYAANVGNSRLYLLREGSLRRISIDHSWVQEAMDLGVLTPEQARKHPNARIITRHLGSQEKMIPDFRIQLDPDETDEQMLQNQGMRLLPKDMLLICSDGLSDVVEDNEIEKAFNEHPPLTALENLTDLVNERGGPDNITSVAISVPEPQIESNTGPDGRQRSAAAQLVVYLISIVILLVLILIGLLSLNLL